MESLASVLAADAGLVEKHLGRYAHTANNAFAALNQAFFSDGAFIQVPDGVEVAEPVQLLYISFGQARRRDDSAAQFDSSRGPTAN